MTATQHENRDNKQNDSPTRYFLVTPKNTHICSTLQKVSSVTEVSWAMVCVPVNRAFQQNWGPAAWQKLRTTIWPKKREKCCNNEAKMCKACCANSNNVTCMGILKICSMADRMTKSQASDIGIKPYILNYTDLHEKNVEVINNHLDLNLRKTARAIALLQLHFCSGQLSLITVVTAWWDEKQKPSKAILNNEA